MTTLRKMVMAGALFIAATPSFAEDAHHPADAAPEKPPAASPMPGGQQGMMGASMMSGGMMSMMGMMSSGAMPMMEQMGQMMAPEHIDGRIAFFKTELRITEAQQKLWDAFAEVLRANTRSMADMMTAMPGGMPPSQSAASQTLPQRVEAHERMLATRLDALRQLKAALEPLYAALDDKQKRTADELLMPGPIGPM